MKIAFIWWLKNSSEIYLKWRDGLRSALELLEKEHKVFLFFDKTLPDPGENYDFILTWNGVSDGDVSLIRQLNNFNAKKGICLTTEPKTDIGAERLRVYDVVFAESSVVYDICRMHGLRTIVAFGTDTDFFSPDISVKKDIKYFYPATFSPWKCQSEIAYLGDKLLCVGTVQPDGKAEYGACKKAGVKIEEGYFPVEKIRDYYQRSKSVIIPAIHGSERTVLEAMSCNILPIVTNSKNVRTKSYLSEYKRSGCKTPREFVLKNYSHKIYAEQIMKGIND